MHGPRLGACSLAPGNAFQVLLSSNFGAAIYAELIDTIDLLRQAQGVCRLVSLRATALQG